MSIPLLSIFYILLAYQVILLFKLFIYFDLIYEFPDSLTEKGTNIWQLVDSNKNCLRSLLSKSLVSPSILYIYQMLEMLFSYLFMASTLLVIVTFKNTNGFLYLEELQSLNLWMISTPLTLKRYTYSSDISLSKFDFIIIHEKYKSFFSDDVVKNQDSGFSSITSIRLLWSVMWDQMVHCGRWQQKKNVNLFLSHIYKYTIKITIIIFLNIFILSHFIRACGDISVWYLETGVVCCSLIIPTIYHHQQGRYSFLVSL